MLIAPPKTPNSQRHVKETVETTGDKGKRGAQQPGKATHMKGDNGETRSPGTWQQSSECRQSFNEFRTPTVDCLGNSRHGLVGFDA